MRSSVCWLRACWGGRTHRSTGTRSESEIRTIILVLDIPADPALSRAYAPASRRRPDRMQELTPAAAARLIQDTDTLAVPLGPGQPVELLHALGARERFEQL